MTDRHFIERAQPVTGADERAPGDRVMQSGIRECLSLQVRYSMSPQYLERTVDDVCIVAKVGA